MHIHGSPISKTAISDLPDLMERFWFWRGASGENYIHSVYEPESCPPLPGAVFVGVQTQEHERVAVKVGRFSPFFDQSPDFSDCDEVHVHLLARGPEAAERVRGDLALALGDFALMPGLHEASFLLAA